MPDADQPSALFILGHDPNTPSRLDPTRPQLYTQVNAEHSGVRYCFDRWQSEGWRLALYRDTDYPAPMVESLLSTGLVRRVSVGWIWRNGFQESDVKRARTTACLR